MRTTWLLLMLAACTQGVDDSGNSPAPAGGPANGGPAAAGDVFLAVVSGSEGYNAPEALPRGAFLVEEGCLVFRYAGGGGLRRTPLLPPGSALSADRRSLTIGGTAVPIGQDITVSGGDLPASVVRTSIPGRCPQEALLVTAIAGQ